MLINKLQSPWGSAITGDRIIYSLQNTRSSNSFLLLNYQIVYPSASKLKQNPPKKNMQLILAYWLHPTRQIPKCDQQFSITDSCMTAKNTVKFTEKMKIETDNTKELQKWEGSGEIERTAEMKTTWVKKSAAGLWFARGLKRTFPLFFSLSIYFSWSLSRRKGEKNLTEIWILGYIYRIPIESAILTALVRSARNRFKRPERTGPGWVEPARSADRKRVMSDRVYAGKPEYYASAPCKRISSERCKYGNSLGKHSNLQ